MIDLHLLGSVELRGRDGRPVEPVLRQSKRVAVLAYLATARPRGLHRRDKVVALFWPDLGDDRARAGLRSTLSHLREHLGDDAIATRGANEIGVNTQVVRCDVAELDDAIAGGDLNRVLRLYRGPFMDGVHVDGVSEELEHWVSVERQRIRDGVQRAVHRAVDDAEASADLRTALTLAQRALEMFPGDERLARRVMALLIGLGDRGAAVAVFDELERRLRSEFDVSPAPETTELLSIARAPLPPRAPMEPRPSAPSSPEPPSRRIEAAHGGPHGDADAPNATAQSPWRRLRVAAGVAIVLGIGGLFGTLIARSQPVGDTSRHALAQWTAMTPRMDNAPPPRTHAETFVDSTGDAAVMMFGIVTGGPAASSPVMDDIWRMRGLRPDESHAWTKLSVAAGPAPAKRWMFQLEYDPATDRAILHGGALDHSAPCANDTWVLRGASGIGTRPQWHEVRIEGPMPDKRGGMHGGFDPASRRLITFGGNDCINTYFQDVRVLAFDDSTLTSGRWITLAPDTSAGAPSRRSTDVVVYSARANRLFVHGGNLGSGGVIAELWALDHANGLGGRPTWRPLRCTGSAPPLYAHTGAYDDANGTLFVFGGIDATSTERNDVWRVRGLGDGGRNCTWDRLDNSTPAPLPRQMAHLMVDPQSRAMVLLGGNTQGRAYVDLWRLEADGGRGAR